MAASSTSVTCTSARARPTAARAAWAMPCRRRRGTRARDWPCSMATGMCTLALRRPRSHSARLACGCGSPGAPNRRSAVVRFRARLTTTRARLGAIVGAHDHRDEVVAHDVAVAEVHELDALHPPQHRLRLHEPRDAARREVHLPE